MIDPPEKNLLLKDFPSLEHEQRIIEVESARHGMSEQPLEEIA
jgi:hypothetical protein